MFNNHEYATFDAVEFAKRDTKLNFERINVDKYYGTDLMPAGYGGLTWSSDWAVSNVEEWYAISPYPDSGWFSGVTSGEQIAWNSGGMPVEITAESFNIDSFELTAVWDKKLSVEIVAYRDDEIIYDETIMVGDKRPTHVDLDLDGIDRLVFTPTEIKVDPDSGGTGPYFVIDDMIVSKVRSLAAAFDGGQRTADQMFPSHVSDGHQPMHPDLGHIVALA